jgi:hypothetical protein
MTPFLTLGSNCTLITSGTAGAGGDEGAQALIAARSRPDTLPESMVVTGNVRFAPVLGREDRLSSPLDPSAR